MKQVHCVVNFSGDRKRNLNFRGRNRENPKPPASPQKGKRVGRQVRN